MTAQMEAIDRPLLRRLANRLGIVESYLDQSGGEVRHTSDHTRERLLHAMGIDASTETRAARALRALQRARLSEWIAPVRVVRKRSRTLAQVNVRVPAMRADVVHWRLTLRTEAGIESIWTGSVPGGATRRLTLPLPVVPTIGYHDLSIAFDVDGQHHSARQRLIVVPSQCILPEARLLGRRGFGKIGRASCRERVCYPV